MPIEMIAPARAPVLATVGLLLLHGALLVATVRDYRVTIDSAYHVSMGRAYGENGLALWDRINFGPSGRPNLQGGFLHAAIGWLGRLLGGDGDDYVLANAILAIAQWAAAMGTAACFSLWLGGEIAMLLAVALLSGAAFAATSFAVGLPSGWLLILTPWAIWFFLEERLVLASVAAALAIYSHIGGYLTTPLGIALAALLARRWRQLLVCVAVTAGLTLPYTIRLIRYAGWLSGEKSHSALLFDPMLDLLAIAGAIRLLRTPRKNPFMTAWLMAPLAWLFQDPGRFFLQWPLGGSVAAGLLLGNELGRITEMRRRIRYAIVIAGLATLAPFGLPSLAPELAWAAGNHYPLQVDWKNMESQARIILRADFSRTLVADYSPLLCPAMAVYADISCEKGAWVEVQPRVDPADDVPAADKTYIIPLASNDSALAPLQSSGSIAVYDSGTRSAPGGGNSVVRLIHRLSVGEAATLASATITREAAWLGYTAVDNSLSLADVLRMSSASGRKQFQARLAIQRARAGRIELACLVYAWALEAEDPEDARTMRQIALRIGILASYLSDQYAIDFLSRSRLAVVKEQFLELAIRSNRLAFDPAPSPELQASFNSLLNIALDIHGPMQTGRPADDWLPWLSGS